MTRVNSLLCGLLVVAVWTLPLEAADWPQWRGPNRDGRSPDKGLLKEWPGGGPKLLWKKTGIGIGFSSAVVVGDTIYITGDIGNTLVMTAMGLDSQTKWQAQHGPGWEGNRSPGSLGSPTYDNGRLYLLSAHGLLKAYDANGGRPIWEVDIKRSFGGRTPTWGYSESPLVYGDMVVVTPGGNSCIVALNKNTGAPVWTSKGLNDPAHYSSCIAFEYQNLPLIVQSTGRGMVCVDARSGQFLWRNDRVASNTANCPTPVFEDGYCFCANGYGTGGACVKLAVQGGGLLAPQAWDTKEMVCHHGGFIVHEGHIYGNNNNGWSCLELATGQKKWGGQGVGKGSLCFADGMLYTFGERGGRMGLVRADPAGFTQSGEFSVEGQGPSWAHPIVVGGRLYIRYHDNLYCFDVRGPDYKEATAAKQKDEDEDKSERRTTRPRPTPRPAFRPEARPDTPEEHARRLYVLAESYLMNNAVNAGKAKLKEIVEKYPDTEHGKKAAARLRELQ